jgi:hypothetical protein
MGANKLNPAWSAEEDAILLDQMLRGRSLSQTKVPGRSQHAVRMRRSILVEATSPTLTAMEMRARRAAKDYVAYAAKYHPGSPLAQMGA